MQCLFCNFVYPARFRSEPVDYRLADSYRHGRLLWEVKIPAQRFAQNRPQERAL
jgi:hypothetical protein